MGGDFTECEYQEAGAILEAAYHNRSVGFLIYDPPPFDPTPSSLCNETLDYFQHVNFMGFGVCALV